MRGCASRWRNVVWEPHLDATDRIESLENEFQSDVNAGEIVFDLGQFACADDRYHRRSPLPKPRQGDLGRRMAALTGQRNDLTDDGFLASVRGHELLHAGGSAGSL